MNHTQRDLWFLGGIFSCKGSEAFLHVNEVSQIKR